MRLLPTILLLTCALTIAACGGGLSRSEYVAEADKICREEEKRAEPIETRISNLDRNATQEETLRELKGAFRDLVPIGERLHDRLDDLEPPEEIRADADRYVAAVKEGVDIVRDAAEVETIAQLRQMRLAEQQKEVEELSERIGFEDCGG